MNLNIAQIETKQGVHVVDFNHPPSLNTSPCPTDSCRNEPIPLEFAGVHRMAQESTGMGRDPQQWTGMALEWTKIDILELRL